MARKVASLLLPASPPLVEKRVGFRFTS